MAVVNHDYPRNLKYNNRRKKKRWNHYQKRWSRVVTFFSWWKFSRLKHILEDCRSNTITRNVPFRIYATKTCTQYISQHNRTPTMITRQPCLQSWHGQCQNAMTKEDALCVDLNTTPHRTSAATTCSHFCFIGVFTNKQEKKQN
jgi:hypothetical protein